MTAPMTTLLLMLAAAGTMFFLVRGVQLRAGYRKMSQLEVKRAALEEAQARENRVPTAERARLFLRRQGYEGDLFPFVAGMAFLYLLTVVVLRVVGLSYTVGTLVGLPASFLLVWAVAAWSARQRRRRFNHQLIDLLDHVAGQIESGNGAQRALQAVVPTMQEPLRSEMNRVLNTQVTTKDLIGSMRELGERYPSRAMGMFISALEIDQAEGQAIGPALHAASELLRRDFALSAEANAEISQTRGEFFAVIGILGGIAGKLLLSSDPQSHAAYASAAGIVVVGLGLANVAFGVYRFLRLLNTARGDM